KFSEYHVNKTAGAHGTKYIRFKESWLGMGSNSWGSSFIVIFGVFSAYDKQPIGNSIDAFL
ncbi:MAG: hypothetical protein Q7I98_04120, partial [Erysipelotrichaceae bacterium]|nr:hypothetical protein [Erysipelotrichaceae bacterium]